MRRFGRIIHILLKSLKWTGVSLSTLLLAATVFCWVRNLGHFERWRLNRFEPRPDWTTPDLPESGVWHWWSARAIRGRLLLSWGTYAPEKGPTRVIDYWREPVSAEKAEEHFDLYFKPGERPLDDGTMRASRFAGVGLWHGRMAIDPQIDRPRYEGFGLFIPFWMLTVVFGLWPLGFVTVRLLRKKRRAPNHCPHCGYDLRATPDPAGPLLPRCPECGAIASGVKS